MRVIRGQSGRVSTKLSGRKFIMSWNMKVLLSVLVTIVLVVLCVWSGLMVTSAHFGRKAYQDGRFETAERHFQTNMRVTPDAWEGWEPPFNRGTTRLRLGVDPEAVGAGPDVSDPADLGGDGGHGGAGTGGAGSDDSDGAGTGGAGAANAETYQVVSDVAMVEAGVADLELALTRVPQARRENGQVVDPDRQPECTVRRNLSIGQELQGDALVAAGDSVAAVEKYVLGQETLAPCQESEQNQDQSERQQQKEQENQQGSGSDGSGDGSGQNDGGSGGNAPNNGPGGQNEGSGADLDPNMQGKEEQLRERNRRGQGDYDDQQNQNYSGGVNW